MKSKFVFWSLLAVSALAQSSFANAIEVNPVPEPATVVSAAALAALIGARFLRRKK